LRFGGLSGCLLRESGEGRGTGGGAQVGRDRAVVVVAGVPGRRVVPIVALAGVAADFGGMVGMERRASRLGRVHDVQPAPQDGEGQQKMQGAAHSGRLPDRAARKKRCPTRPSPAKIARLFEIVTTP